MTQRIGLIAGWGDYPIAIAQRMQQSNIEVVCVGVRGHANERALRECCVEYKHVGLAKIGSQARFFRRHGVTRATMAGKIFKTVIFQKFALLRHMPDLAFFRFYYPHFIARTSDRNDDALILTAISLFNSYGIDFAPATNFAPELLVKQGTFTNRKPNTSQQRDIEFGWRLAKQMGGLDIGQSVVVKGRAALAVEAIEGTDECIRRGGLLCPAGGFTVVKVAKPNQDMRFDVPTVGIGTLKTIRESGGRVLAIEADKTIILDQPAMLEYAERNNIVIVAVRDEAVSKLADVA